MKNRTKASISSSTFGKAFLVKAWEARDELLEYERHGFAQFFYITTCAHIESVLINCIKIRLYSIGNFKWETEDPCKFDINKKVHLCPFDPIISSIRHIASSLEDSIENAPLSKLIKVYNDVFPETLSSVVGKELKKDLDALAKLRNIFAHGRDIFIEFENEDPSNLKGTLDDNPLQYPAQRLQAAGIISCTTSETTLQNHHEFTSVFFCDEAILHFYNIVREIESLLKECFSFLPEKMMYVYKELPEIQA